MDEWMDEWGWGSGDRWDQSDRSDQWDCRWDREGWVELVGLSSIHTSIHTHVNGCVSGWMYECMNV